MTTDNTATRVKQLIADHWRQKTESLPRSATRQVYRTNFWIHIGRLFYKDQTKGFLSCDSEDELTDDVVQEVIDNWDMIQATIDDTTGSRTLANEAEAVKWEQRLTKVIELIESNGTRQ